MNTFGCKLWLLRLAVLFLFLLVIVGSYGGKTKERKEKAKETFLQANDEEIDSAQLKVNQKHKKLAKVSSERKHKLSSGAQNAKKSTHRRHKGRKIKNKTHKNKQGKANFRTLADEPMKSTTTAIPEIDKKTKIQEESHIQNDASAAQDESNLPGWIPHIVKRKCGTCIWQECPSIEIMKQHCPSGIVRDQCNCCARCASGVGMPCYMTNFAPIWLPPCGDDLECIPAFDGVDLDAESDTSFWGRNRNSEGVCSCTDHTPVCGSNNATYENICEFRESAARLKIQKTLITVSNQGPCNTVPTIDSKPRNVVSAIGDVISFRCETSGFPLPRIQWFKINKGKRATEEIELPGYTNHAVTQMRGGPGKYQMTTWLTLDKVKESDSGKYVCRSTNDYGTVDGSASLKINGL